MWRDLSSFALTVCHLFDGFHILRLFHFHYPDSSSDNYIDGYLSTTVHTPVKRYVPSTNSTAVATESTAPMSTCTMNGYHHHSLGSNLPQQQLSPQQTQQQQQSARNTSSSNSTMPSYRYRMKCCSNYESCGSGQASAVGLAAGRGLFRGEGMCRPSDKSTSSGVAQTQTQSPISTLSTSFGLSSSGSGSNSSASSVRSSMRNTQNDHIMSGDGGGGGGGCDLSWSKLLSGFSQWLTGLYISKTSIRPYSRFREIRYSLDYLHTMYLKTQHFNQMSSNPMARDSL